MTDKIKNSTAAAEKKPSENLAIFGPLGKYAVIAVLMVSIIVTTTIMLNKQLSNAENKIAAFESKVAELSKTNSGTIEATEEASAKIQSTTDVIAETSIVEEEVENVVSAQATIEEYIATTAPVTQVEADTAKTTTPVSTAASDNTVIATPEVKAEVNTLETVAQTSKAKNTETHQTRVDTFKAEKKQRISEMFARIKALEAQQLDRYKQQQDKQIERLRTQISQQQEMIEALVLRNEGLFELRATDIKRNQSNREEMLNLI